MTGAQNKTRKTFSFSRIGAFRFVIAGIASIALTFGGVVTPASATVSALTDCKFGVAQVFDVQYSISGGNLHFSSVTYPYGTPGPHLSAGTWSGNDYMKFIPGTPAGTLGLERFNGAGVSQGVFDTTGTFRAMGDDFIFYLGNGSWGTVITTGAGFAYGSGGTLPISIENPTNDQALAYTNCIAEPIAAGGTRDNPGSGGGGGGGAPDAPGKPTDPVVTPGNGQATISWTAPSDGGDPESYTVTAQPGGATCTATAPDTTCTITELTNGYPYTFSITAENETDSSAATTSKPATPTGSGEDGTLTLYFDSISSKVSDFNKSLIDNFLTEHGYTSIQCMGSTQGAETIVWLAQARATNVCAYAKSGHTRLKAKAGIAKRAAKQPPYRAVVITGK